MGKCLTAVFYILGALVFAALGALAAGLSVYYSFDDDSSAPQEDIYANCILEASSVGTGVAGTIFFKQLAGSDSVNVNGTITGLAKGLHGFHIHTYGVVGGECGAAEGHYNPNGFNHAAPSAPQRHVGDLGNIMSVEDGTATGTAVVDITDEVINLYGDRSIMGRSVVIHKGEDDLGLGGDEGSISTGNAGARLACCTIFLISSSAV